MNVMIFCYALSCLAYEQALCLGEKIASWEREGKGGRGEESL